MAYGDDLRNRDNELKRRMDRNGMTMTHLGSRHEKELKKKELTEKAEEAEAKQRFSEAEAYWLEIADICHEQRFDDDAYWVEHRALQCRHMQIYKKAGISIRAFRGAPNADKLQDALSDAAKAALDKGKYGVFTVYSLLNARLCHAQGKEKDAFWLEEATKPYGFFEEYFVRDCNSSKRPALEEICLENIANNYGDELYPR